MNDILGQSIPLHRLDDILDAAVTATCGIPSIVTFAIRYLKYCFQSEMVDGLLGGNFVNYLIHAKQLHHVAPFSGLRNGNDPILNARAKLYLELMALSVLNCPIPTKISIVCEEYGYTEKTSILQILRDLSIYVSRAADAHLDRNLGIVDFFNANSNGLCPFFPCLSFIC